MKKLFLAIFMACVSGCTAQFDEVPTTYQHFRWCWGTFWEASCFPSRDLCETDAVAHETELVTPCRRERYFSHER